ncbi:MAG: S66 peptidase family protein [Deltaproteobacteria bacterium]
MKIKPARLRKGDRIGILAPAGPVLREEVRPGLDFLKSLGFEPVCSPHLYDRKGYLAGDDQARVKDLHAMFRDRKIRAVLCARGGYGIHRILQDLDYGLFSRHPKILVGYSDITALLLAVFKKSGLITLHGPVLRDLLKGDGRNAALLMNLLTTGESMTVNFSDGTIVRKGRAEGVLLGGNLSLICQLLGTPFLPSFKGKLLFIEEKGEPLYRIDRMLSHLLLSGEIEKCAGLMLGSFEECGDPAAVVDLVGDRCSRLNMPIVTGLPVGHGVDNVPLPVGARAVLDTTAMTLGLKEACVNG